jgi:hypothetical protein
LAGSGARGLVGLTLGFALFVVAGLGAGLIIWRDPPPKTSANQAAPSAAAGGPGSTATELAPTGQLDERTRLASIGSASMTLPAPPYELADDPTTVNQVFDVLFLANADVHPRYDGRHSWSATVAFGQVTSSLSDPGQSRPDSTSLEQAGTAAMQKLAQHFFGEQPTTVRNVRYGDRSVDSHSGALLTAEVHYSIAKLPSSYDKVSALLVRLDDGSVIVAVSSIPNDADPTLVKLAADSLESLTIG